MQLQHAAFFYLVMVVVYLVQGLFHFLGGDVGQEAQTAGINAQDGDAFGSYPAGSFQESAVASEADDHVGLKIISVKQFGRGQGEAHFAGKELVELPADAQLGVAAFQQAEQGGRVDGLAGLVVVSEYGEFHVQSDML